MKLRVNATIFSAALVSAVAVAGTHKYSGFNVSPPDQPTLVFQFSSAEATVKDPVVISVAGRQLRAEDGQYRTHLQGLWVQRNVPSSYKFQVRDMVMCPKLYPNNFGACDHYGFTDAAGHQHDFYIYIGNWP